MVKKETPATTNETEVKLSDFSGLFIFLAIAAIVACVVAYCSVVYPTRERFAFGDNIKCQYTDGIIKGTAIAESKKHVMVDTDDGYYWTPKKICEKQDIPPKFYWANSGAVERTIRQRWSD